MITLRTPKIESTKLQEVHMHQLTPPLESRAPKG